MKLIDTRRALTILLMMICLAAIKIQHHFLVNKVVAGGTQIESSKNRFQLSRDSVARTVVDTQFLQKSYPAFTGLVHQNRVELISESLSVEASSTQRKISWIKLLESARSDLNISKMSFEVYPIESVTEGQEGLSVDVGFEAIILDVSLLHEGVLGELMNYLYERAPVMFTVSKMSIDRNSNGPGRSSAENINAEIAIRWYVIRVEEHGNVAS